MHFSLIDHVLEAHPDRLVALKHVTASEEYLQDHFPTFPVLPGVFMLEAMVQTARQLLTRRHGDFARHVLGSVRALKYGSFVRPGDSMLISVSLSKDLQVPDAASPAGWPEGGAPAVEFRGSAQVVRGDSPPQAPEDRPTCVSGRFVLRPPLVRPAVLAGASGHDRLG